jgi:undecaprenyl diphosphate synthase
VLKLFKKWLNQTRKPVTVAAPERELDKVPAHVAISMDGNGRWAKQRGLRRVAGHHSGM